MTEDQMWRMSDEELEEAFEKAKAESSIPDIEYEDNSDNSDDEEIQTINMEQPDDEDSDSDLTVDDIDTETVEEESDDKVNEPDEEIKIDEDQPDETDKVDVKDTDSTFEDKVIEFMNTKTVSKANGLEYEFTNGEKLEMFDKVFAQARDYTKKTQAIKPWRKTIDAFEQANVSQDEVNLMIDVLKGDKGAIAAILKRTGVDALELDIENTTYKPNDYGRDDSVLAFNDVVNEIKVDREYEVTHRVLSRDWDESSFRELTKDPVKVKLLHNDVKSGTFYKVQAVADKIKVYDNGRKSDLEYYMEGAKELKRQELEEERVLQAREEQRLAREAKLAKQVRVEEVKAKQIKQKEVVADANRRRAAAPTKASAGSKKSVIDYLDDSEESFDNWLKNVKDKY